jgi:WD40 repeat protein
MEPVDPPLAGHSSPVLAVAFDAGGTTLASGAENGSMVLWDTSDPSRVRRLADVADAGAGGVHSLEFSPDGRILASGTGGGGVILWDVTDPGRPRRLPTATAITTGNDARVESIAFSADGRRLAAGDTGDNDGYADGTAVVWDVSEPGRPRAVTGPLTGHTGPTEGLGFFPGGAVLAVAGRGPIESGGGDVVIWDLARPGGPGPMGEPLSFPGGVKSLAVAPDGRTIAVGGRASVLGEVALWDVTDIAAPSRIEPSLHDAVADVGAVRFSPDGRTLFSGSTEVDGAGQLIRWDTADRVAPLRVSQKRGTVQALALAPDGRTLAVGDATDDGAEVTVWDLTDIDHPRTVGSTIGGLWWIGSLAFNPAGTVLAVAGSEPGSEGVTLWDVTGAAGPVRTMRLEADMPANGMAFSPNGQLIAAGLGDSYSGEGALVIWNLADRALPYRISVDVPDAGWVRSVAFSRDGRRLVHNLPSSDGDGILMWDVSDPAEPRKIAAPMTGHDGSVGSIAYSPNGHTLVTGGDDGTVVVWNLDDKGRPRRIDPPLTGHVGAVAAVVFAPDGRTFATADGEGSVRLWDMTDPGRPRQLGKPLSRSGRIGTLAFTPDGESLVGGGESAVRWAIGDHLSLRRRAVDLACEHGDGGFDRGSWARYVDGVAYQESC